MPMDRTACDIMRLTFVRGGVFALLSGDALRTGAHGPFSGSMV